MENFDRFLRKHEAEQVSSLTKMKSKKDLMSNNGLPAADMPLQLKVMTAMEVMTILENIFQEARFAYFGQTNSLDRRIAELKGKKAHLPQDFEIPGILNRVLFQAKTLKLFDGNHPKIQDAFDALIDTGSKTTGMGSLQVQERKSTQEEVLKSASESIMRSWRPAKDSGTKAQKQQHDDILRAFGKACNEKRTSKTNLRILLWSPT